MFMLCMGNFFTQHQNRVNVEVSGEYHSVFVWLRLTDKSESSAMCGNINIYMKTLKVTISGPEPGE